MIRPTAYGWAFLLIAVLAFLGCWSVYLHALDLRNDLFSHGEYRP